MKVFYAFVLFALVEFFLPAPALAQSVTFFSVSPQSVNSGGQVDFYWTINNSGGYSFLVPCSPGIKLKKQDGSIFSCDTKVSSTVTVNDSLRLTIANISGGTKNVTARLIPKDAGGQDYASAGRDITVTVATSPQPITSFIASATTTVSGQVLTVSWSSQDLDGVNLSVECRDEIKITSSGYTGFLPCGMPVFTTDLSSSGALSLNFTNSSASTLSYKLTLLPAISSKSYDGTHSSTLTLDVASDIVPDPAITSFTASSTMVNSGENFNISWNTEKAGGAMLRISCVNLLTATSSKNPDAILPCDSSAFSEMLPAGGSLTFAFQNKDKSNSAAVLTLMPARKDGKYDALRGRNVAINVRPAITAAVFAPTVTQAAPAATVQPSVSASLALVPRTKPETVFTKSLQQGSQGDDVSALQEFLKKDPAVYPEGIVSGYFGPATERAVQRFQKKYGVVGSGAPSSTGYGMVGSKTLNKLNELKAQTLPTSAPNTLSFIRGIGVGSRGDDISALQEFLKKDPAVYPEGIVSGYFGPATERAVRRFQEKHNLAAPGVAGYGFVGPKTRAKLNELQ